MVIVNVKVRMYRNGDQYFCGMVYVVSPDRHRTFESLLSDLTQSIVCDLNLLPSGVRYLFSADTGRRMTTIEQLVDGASYVCSSTCLFRRLDYTRISLQIPTRTGLYHPISEVICSSVLWAFIQTAFSQCTYYNNVR